MLKGRTCIAIPPGATITEQLADKGITRKAFALKMGLSERRVIALLHGEDRLTPDIAVRLESVLGVPAQFWNNLERIYLDKRALIERENESKQKARSIPAPSNSRRRRANSTDNRRTP